MEVDIGSSKVRVTPDFVSGNGIKMTSATQLLFNEQLHKQLPDVQKPLYVLEWLRQLEAELSTVSRVSHRVYCDKSVPSNCS